MPEQAARKIALILNGGGARAAYQIGVLKAIAEIIPKSEGNPFPILCGTSAGSINAAALAATAPDFKFMAHSAKNSLTLVSTTP